MKTTKHSMKMGIRNVAIIALGVAAACAAYGTIPDPSAHYECVPSTSTGGASCIAQEDMTCKYEGLACQWKITDYSCLIVKGPAPDQCKVDSDCTGNGAVDTKWCYTCAGGCLCTAA